jgi:membrane protease YdiL (CAAX protease family)
VRGEAGLAVGALVVLTCLAAERLLFGRPPARAARELGLGRPAPRGMLVAAAVCIALLLVLPAYAGAVGARLEPYPGWPWLLPGLFAQAGIAEEVLFRGYLFRHVRRGRTFWRAALLASAPFVLVHLVLFLTLPWPIALAALALSVVVSFPLAHLFELGGGTIWAPALVHFVIQGAIKVATVPGPEGALLPLVWMAASALLTFAAFLASPARPAPGPAAPLTVEAA